MKDFQQRTKPSGLTESGDDLQTPEESKPYVDGSFKNGISSTNHVSVTVKAVIGKILRESSSIAVIISSNDIR